MGSASNALFVMAAGAIGVVAVAMAAAARHLMPGDAVALDDVELATRYMLFHAAALLALAALGRERQGRLLAAAGILFVLGCVLFGGGLILLGLTRIDGFAVAVPFGGTSFILGWLALALWGGLDYRRARAIRTMEAGRRR